MINLFSVAKVGCMEDYIQPPLRKMVAHIMIQIGKNGVPMKKYIGKVAGSIFSLAFKQKSTLFFSSVTTTGKTKIVNWNVNWNVKEMYHEKNYSLQILVTL